MKVSFSQRIGISGIEHLKLALPPPTGKVNRIPDESLVQGANNPSATASNRTSS